MKSFLAIQALTVTVAGYLNAAVLFTQSDPITANETGAGSNLVGMTVARGGAATDTLYFRYTVTTLGSNKDTEGYYAGMHLYEGGSERLGIGNSWGASAYSAFGGGIDSLDLNSSNHETGANYQLVRSTDAPITIVFKVEYVSGGNDNITAWLNPDFSKTEAEQAASLTTAFAADASFNELHLREGGGGSGWTYENIKIADSSTSIGFVPEPAAAVLSAFGLFGLLRRRRSF